MSLCGSLLQYIRVGLCNQWNTLEVTVCDFQGYVKKTLPLPLWKEVSLGLLTLEKPVTLSWEHQSGLWKDSNAEELRSPANSQN